MHDTERTFDVKRESGAASARPGWTELAGDPAGVEGPAGDPAGAHAIGGALTVVPLTVVPLTVVPPRVHC
jgi:hypothetical protein